MRNFILLERHGQVGVITLNRPEIMNAWNTPMREDLVRALIAFEADPHVRAIIITGAGTRAFCAGQDLNEAKTFDPDRAEEWIGEWDRLYDRIRTLSKPIVAALNGVAAGSAFQVALVCDFRIGHPGVRMGQPEINSGIASVTGPWIMRELIGLARTIDLTLTGRLMDADECLRIGIINQIVPQERVPDESHRLANELAKKPPVAMRLDRQRFREMTQEGFKDAMKAAVRIHRESYATGEPAQMMEHFLSRRAAN